MIDAKILGATTFVYFAAFAFYLLRMASGRESWGRWGALTALAGLAAHTAALALRWVSSYQMGIGHAPLSNLYESLIFFSWSITAVYLFFERRMRDRSLGVLVLPAAFLFMAYASLSPHIDSRIQPLIPALQSNWLVSHVVTCFLGYAAFTVAFAAGLMMLVKGPAIQTGGKARPAGTAAREENGRNPGPRRERSVPARFMALIPAPAVLDDLIYQSVVLGFVFLAIGIMTGSIWAHHAWGSYWSWDPKETWSLVTWLVYAIMLHSRYIRGWRERPMAVMAVIGFICVLITYLGVNLLPGLHTYQ
ncbi:MAG: c-type cytochrome biogenesis protein CcsB [Pseudomonadota bacterium]|nr:c-type cytochrome biogenesis protein CcsB [Pseudomonadota bacterium]